jgi:hypothetical protein
MEIRMVDSLEIKDLKSAVFPHGQERNSMARFRSWLRELGFGRPRCFLVAELEGKALGYLVGVLVDATGKLEDFFVATNDGMAEVAQGLMEIFEVLCLERHCNAILAPIWMDEGLIKARGFHFSGSLYVKTLD